MKRKSIWLEGISSNTCPKLEHDIDVDVLIIGGGITGISTAYHLTSQNLSVCLVEKNKIAEGVTSRTTGKLTYLQENIYTKLKTYHGKEKAKLYLESQKKAIQLVKGIIKKENIECDLQKVHSYVFSNQNEKKICNEKNLLHEFGISVRDTTALPTGENISYGFYVEDTYVFHPLKYAYSLKDICLHRGISIYENTKIISIDKEEEQYLCKTENHMIKAKYVVFAVHYPYFIIPFWMPLKAYIEKSYIEAFKVDKNYKFSAITISSPTISTRYHSDKNCHYQLYLTNSHNLCIKNNEKENFEQLLQTKKISPDYIWSNKDIMTVDSIPYIGSINKENTLLIGTGYNTWGMTNGSIAGKIISDIILQKQNPYIELFDPKRGINIGKLMNFPIILSSNVYSFAKSKIRKQKSWYPSSVRFEIRNGENLAIYVDENQKEHIVYNVCPHLKCGLIFNEVEKTWDCPCHGSRFDIDGNCIEGPSNYNITYKAK